MIYLLLYIDVSLLSLPKIGMHCWIRFVTHIRSFSNFRRIKILFWFLSLSAQVKGLHESLDRRISSLESMKQTEASQHGEAIE